MIFFVVNIPETFPHNFNQKFACPEQIVQKRKNKPMFNNKTNHLKSKKIVYVNTEVTSNLAKVLEFGVLTKKKMQQSTSLMLIIP